MVEEKLEYGYVEGCDNCFLGPDVTYTLMINSRETKPKKNNKKQRSSFPSLLPSRRLFTIIIIILLHCLVRTSQNFLFASVRTVYDVYMVEPEPVSEPSTLSVLGN